MLRQFVLALSGIIACFSCNLRSQPQRPTSSSGPSRRWKVKARGRGWAKSKFHSTASELRILATAVSMTPRPKNWVIKKRCEMRCLVMLWRNFNLQGFLIFSNKKPKTRMAKQCKEENIVIHISLCRGQGVVSFNIMMQRTSNENAACLRRICKRCDQPKKERIASNSQTWRTHENREWCKADQPCIIACYWLFNARGMGRGEGGTAIFGLNRYVPLWRVWFSSSLL